MTMQVQAILRVFLSDPAQRRYGLELCEATELPSGTVYPVLARLEQIGWLNSHWEEPDTHVDAGRPRRRYYTITPDGTEKSRDAITRAYAARRRPAPGWLHRPSTAGDAS
ncbi:PadR family transcriptional regulator [Planomonospora venezuelensis]|uniref:DNA-binding PadR family transcriptional regulator n=1 Tax=Planomonospora venezuelensis TaxID=1999 RepID=A0A841D207_PLAVE|nr:helix-turn-helix transcriptional regulator [Planomonospora venezuelensis]MBB5962534.1 DNA-binding PadR family transcriptional regulator [Planomonospora venezuelensis]GIM99061.1 hypothetical protein Pve01_07200 [Planomonospora venezuelensis]